jgi:hypothetical protein
MPKQLDGESMDKASKHGLHGLFSELGGFEFVLSERLPKTSRTHC